MSAKIAAAYRNLLPRLPQIKILFFCICLLVQVSTYAQPEILQNVQGNRFAGQIYLNKEKYDSAYRVISRFVQNETLANPYDYLNFSLCNYQRKDTGNFLHYLNKAIAAGVDSTKIKSFLRKLAGADKLFLDQYLNVHYEQLRTTGWATYDTVLIKEATSIEYLDQFAREPLMRLTAGKADSSYNYLLYLQRQADSINYVRVTRLLEAGRFPGYHNCGAFSSLTIVLIHLGDYNEAQWEHLFNLLKMEVLAGNISPVEMGTITDNHYQRGKGKLCSYYGQWTGRTTELCDCKEVDKYRAAIGLSDLQTEYRLKDKAVPECYTPLSLPSKK